LRKLIDLRMEENNNQGPPFEDRVALRIMGQIARGMYTLHKSHILHRDLKAANVLVAQFSSGNYMEYPDCYVADFECSIGVAGTGFWRAPEVLQALKNRNGAVSDACSSKADVYSFSMTCYEVLTGCFPFEGQSMTNYDLVLSGHRPALPDYVDANVKALLHRCWNADPSKRPSFKKILKVLARLIESSQLPFYGWRSSQTWYLERFSDSPQQQQQQQQQQQSLDDPESPSTSP
jgi:serine/threonine protein kinase